MSCDKTHHNGFAFKLGAQIHAKLAKFLGIDSGTKGNQYLRVAEDGQSIIATPHIADTEYRSLLGVIAGQDKYYVEQGDVIDIVAISPTNITWANENGVWRNLNHSLQDDVFRRIGSSNKFSDDYNSNSSTLVSGVYAIEEKIEIVKSGYYAGGWIDLYKLKELVDSQDSAGAIGTSTEAEISFPLKDGEIVWVSDQLFHVYSKGGDWYKLSDDSLWKEMPTRDLDLYLMLGQSNMHGHADLQGASTDITDAKTNVLFRTAWHDSTSNATTQLYESDWADQVEAGKTRGDDGVSTIGNSTKFGPEIGFVHEGKTNGLFGANTPAIFKYAVGASSLFYDSDNNGVTLSDWDTDEPLANRNGDCWRAYKTAFNNAIDALQAKGHRVFLRGVIWFQGESDGQKATPEGTIENKLKTLWDKIRTHALEKNISYSNTNMVITRISDASGEPVSWADEYKRMSDKYIRIGLVDATIYNSGTNIHIEQEGMFGIGKAYAREMKRVNNQASHDTATNIASTNLVIGASSNESTLTESGGNITEVSDLSNQGNDWLADSNSTIEKISAEFYNQDVLHFNNNTDFLEVANVQGLGLGNKVCFFHFFNPTNRDGGQDGAFAVRDLTNSSTGTEIITILPGGASGFNGFFYHQLRTEGASIFTNSTAITGWNLISWEIDTVANTTTGWLNGNQLFSVADSGSLPINSDWKIMANHNAPSTQGGSSILEGYWAEFYAVKDSYDREKIEGAIMHKYGLARKLPATHAYREIIP